MNIKTRIKAAGKAITHDVTEVKCQGCGKEIRSDGNLQNIEYVKTKRGTELFFHTECKDKVWEHGIV